MCYLAYVIALLAVVFGNTQGMTLTQGADRLLDIAVSVNKVFLWVAIAIWVLLLAMIIIIGKGKVHISFSNYHHSLFGCIVLFLMLIVILLPVIQYGLYRFSMVFASSFGPEGIIEPVKFWACSVVMLIFGLG